MKKVNGTSEAIENVMNAVTNNVAKSGKSGKSEQSEATKVTVKDSKARFISFVCSKEEIGLNKFFKLFEAFKNEDANGYKDYLFARKMDVSVNYTFKWFSENCPCIEDANGKKQFAKWTKVTERVPRSKNEAYNRISATNVEYTLVPYNCYKANWEQYEAMLNHVVTNIKRLQREKEAAKRAKEAEANKAKAIEAKQKQIANLEAQLKKLKAA